MTHVAAVRRLKAEFGDLLAHHEQARDLDEFARYEDDPVGFIRDVLKGDPWSAQIAIAESVRDDPLVVVRSCNAAGKDWVSAQLALWWVYARCGLVLLTGPTERQVREIVMGEVGRAFGKADDLPGELFQMALRLGRTEQAGILAFTSSDASRLTGFHAPRLMVCITEAQGVEPFTFEAALACATGSENRILAVGNPLSPSGRFFEISRSDSWTSHRISAFDCPSVVEGREIIPGAITVEGVERIAREYGEGSGIYRARVLGEFPEESEYGLVQRSSLEAAAERHDALIPTVDAIREPPIVAVDPARFGPDKTAVAVLRGPVLTRLKLWSRKDTMETTGLVVEELRRAGVRPARDIQHDERLQQLAWERSIHGGPPRTTTQAVGTVVVDEIGVGAGIVDRLTELGYAVRGFGGGASPSSFSVTDKFLNLRAEAYWTLRTLLEAGEIAIPRDDRLWDELVSIQWRPNSAGRIQLEAKDTFKSRVGRSPDRADAVVMAFYAWSEIQASRHFYNPDNWTAVRL
jgi:hypothetical protein